MTTKTTGLIATGFLAIGILVGAAGTIVVRDTTASDLADHMRRMTASAGSMGEMSSMMGAGASMMPGASMAPDASTSPEDHLKHHALPSPAATR